MERKHTLIDNAAEKRYELDLGDGMALAEYVLGCHFVGKTLPSCWHNVANMLAKYCH